MYTKPSDRFKFDHSTTSQLIPTAVNNTADYCSILADPFDEYINARIPDRCNLPSRVVSLYAEGVIQINANGVGGLYVPLTKHAPSAVFFDEALASTDSVIAFNSAQTFAGAATVASAATRLVAAGIKLECMASDGYNGGTIYSVQKSRFENATNPLTSSGAMTSARCNGFGPAKYGAFATYRPIDEADNQYVSTSVACGLLQVHVNLGLYPPTSVVPAAQFKYKIVLHYEILPSADTENGPGTLAYGPMDTAADVVVDKMARSIPPVGGGSEDASLTQNFNEFRRATAAELQKAKMFLTPPLIMRGGPGGPTKKRKARSKLPYATRKSILQAMKKARTS